MRHARFTPNLLVLFAVAMAALAVTAHLIGPRVEAQAASTRIAYVDSGFVVSLHPAMATVDALIENARAELGDLDRQLSTLDNKARSGAELSAQESELFQVLLSTRSAVQARYDDEINQAAAPALSAAQAAIASVAHDLDIGMVFEVNAANDTGTIVYADPALDITAAVADAMSASGESSN